ncbi:MAG: ParB/RepB/Spo0J family partition protein [Methylococcales bacterium]
MDFSKSMKKKEKKNNIQLNDLLVPTSNNTLIGESVKKQAIEEGRFLVITSTNFYPDPNQPRKDFDEDKINELMFSIESRGQHQPIIVGEKTDKGYPIIAGERRWRAISGSTKLDMVEAVISKGKEDLVVLLIQIDENNQREDINAIDNASSFRRVVDICKNNKKPQSVAASILNVSPGRLSVILSLNEAPEYIRELSSENKIQDVDTLYNLTKIDAIDSSSAKKLLSEWEDGDTEDSLRSLSKACLDKTKDSVKSGGSKKSNSKAKANNGVKQVNVANISKVDDDHFLTILLGKKEIKYKINADVALALKQDIQECFYDE